MQTARPLVSFLRRWEPGDATVYIWHGINAGDRIVLFVRVSVRGNSSHLQHQIDALRAEAARVGAVVVAIYEHVGPGHDNPYRHAPCWACAVARAARLARRHRAKLFAETTDRFVRHPAYCKEQQSWQARDCDLDELRLLTAGVTLATLLHPNASPAAVRGQHSRRGQQATGRRGGRPSAKEPGHKKRRADELRPRVLKLRTAGASYREIEATTKVPAMTAWRWVQSHQRT